MLKCVSESKMRNRQCGEILLIHIWSALKHSDLSSLMSGGVSQDRPADHTNCKTYNQSGPVTLLLYQPRGCYGPSQTRSKGNLLKWEGYETSEKMIHNIAILQTVTLLVLKNQNSCSLLLIPSRTQSMVFLARHSDSSVTLLPSMLCPPHCWFWQFLLWMLPPTSWHLSGHPVRKSMHTADMVCLRRYITGIIKKIIHVFCNRWRPWVS